MSLRLFEGFSRLERPGAARTILQLTQGEDFCYPLYYYIPSLTADGRYLVYYRETPGEIHEIQLGAAIFPECVTTDIAGGCSDSG